MEKLKRKPGALGLGLGGLVLLLSTFLAWLKISNAEAGIDERIRAASTFTGQTVMLLGFLAIMCGFGVLASAGGGRIWFALLGLLTGAAALAVALWGLFDPAALAAQMASTTTVQNLSIAQTGDTAKSAMDAAFAAGTLDASIAIGLIVGLVGAVLIVLGALFSFKRPAPQVR
jgi:hypothetical protein